MHYCKEKKGLFITNNAKMSRWFFDTTRRKMREKKCDDNVKMGRILLKGQHFSVQFFIRSCCFKLNLLWNIQETWYDFSFCVNLGENFAQFSITFKCLPFIIFSAWLPLCYQNLTQPSKRLMLCCSATTKTMYFWLTARIAGNQN